LAVILIVVVMIAALSFLVGAALFLRPSIPLTGTGEVAGSGRAETRELQFKDFTTVHLGSAFQSRITYSNSYRVSVTIDDNLFDYLQVTKEGDVLAIGLKPGYEYRYSSLTLSAEIQLPDLRELQSGGATRNTIQGFNFSHELVLRLSGASSTEMTDVSVGDAEIEISGASTLSGKITANGDARFTLSGASTATVGGKANNLLITVSGASNTELSNFIVHNAKVNLSGASQATINLDGRLDADLSGASRLVYIGNPTLGDISVTGGSTITKK
jgi:hypothetical protein